MSDESNVCPLSSSVISELLHQKTYPALGLATAVQCNHGGVGSQRLRFSSLWPTRVSPTCSPVLQTNSWTAACSCRVCCVALTTQSWCSTSVLSHSIEFIVPGWLIFGHSVLHGFSLPYSSSQAALLTSGTKPHYFKAPFPVIFQKELSVTLSCPSLNVC